MKSIFLTILIIVLVVLFGTWPLSILAKILDYIAMALNYIAKALDLFGWNGII